MRANLSDFAFNGADTNEGYGVHSKLRNSEHTYLEALLRHPGGASDNLCLTAFAKDGSIRL
jgi:hypothetical protein